MGAPAVEAPQAARRVAKEVRALSAELVRLRSENEELRAERRELLETLSVISALLGGPSGARRAAGGRRTPPQVRGDTGQREPEEAAGLLLASGSCSVSWDGQEVSLAPREFALLSFLLDHRGQPLPRQTLLRAVFPTSSGDPRTLRVHVQAIRAKLARLGRVPVRLTTVYAVGYRLDRLDAHGERA